jgi:hypothetical protein
MKRTLTAVLLTGGATVLLASPALAQPVSEPAGCQGYLSSYANPNMGFIIHELVQPAAEELGVTVGKVIVVNAQKRGSGLEGCIPE